MTMKNKYVNRAHVSERKFQQLVRLFATDLDASQIAKLTGLNRNTVNRYLKKIRQCLVKCCDLQSPFSGEVDVDESCLVDVGYGKHLRIDHSKNDPLAEITSTDLKVSGVTLKHV